jgi:hypothetical protein
MYSIFFCQKLGISLHLRSIGLAHPPQKYKVKVKALSQGPNCPSYTNDSFAR